VTRTLTVTAHGRSYRVLENTDPLAGLAAAKVTRAARHGKPYESPLLEHIHSLHLQGVAVDAGASVGGHSLYMAAVCGLRVHAFEPLVHEQAVANVALNNLWHRIEVHPVALGDRPGRVRHVRDGIMEPGGDIEVRTLDSYELDDVAVIKIDVEGMEPSVLRGAADTIRRCRPVIFAEEHNQAEHDAIAAVLEPAGYTMRDRFDGKRAATPVGEWRAVG
jgi:FkbM family methyltransferase